MIVKHKLTNAKTLFIAVVALLTSTLPMLHAGEKQPMVGEPAPIFSLQGMDGKTYSLAAMKNKYVVVHFATTWCPFCNAEAPHLEQLYKSYKNKGVQVLIIDVKEEKQLVSKWMAKFNFSFPVLLDEDGSVATRYAPEGVQPALARDEVPLASNLIIDKKDKIRFYSLLDTSSFDAELTEVKRTLDALLMEGTP